MKITKFKSIDKGSLVGFVSVEIPKWGAYINNIAVCQKNGHRWINFPSQPYENKEGETKYMPYIGLIERDHKEVFEKKVLAALDEYATEHQAEPEQFDIPF